MAGWAIIANYKNGQPDGLQEMWYVNGNKVQINYKDGIRLYVPEELTTIVSLHEWLGTVIHQDEIVNEALYGRYDSIEKVNTGIDKVSSIWFEQYFKNINEQIHVFFIKTENIDIRNGKITDCNACSNSTSVGAITYRLNDNNWEVLSIQNEFSNGIGSWGKTPEIKQVKEIQIGHKKIALLIDYNVSWQGYNIDYQALYFFSKNKWQDVGVIEVSQNNSGTCGVGLQKCWGNEGVISVIESSKDYPDLLVAKTGTQTNDNNHIVPAENMTYIYDGEKYIIKK